MRLVLDSNILIAAYISKGLCSEILEACLKEHELVISDFIVQETEGHLVRKFQQPAGEVREYLHILGLHSEVVKPVVFSKTVCRDPKDDLILGTALAGKAVYLVSGDKDLLSLKKHRSIQILTPRDFWSKVMNK